MSARIEVSSESGVIVLGDPPTALPASLDQEALLRQLEPVARSGRIFFLVADDPVKYRIDVIANEPLPAELDREFELLGGSLRLEAPNGSVALIGSDKTGQPREAGMVPVSSGAHVLSVFGRRPFDGKRHAEDMTKLLGADAKFMHMVDRMGLIGCLPLILVALCLFARRWRLLWYLVPLLVVSYLPYLALRRSRRYKTAEARVSNAELARPHFVISLAPTQQDGLHGGFVRV